MWHDEYSSYVLLLSVWLCIFISFVLQTYHLQGINKSTRFQISLKPPTWFFFQWLWSFWSASSSIISTRTKMTSSAWMSWKTPSHPMVCSISLVSVLWKTSWRPIGMKITDCRRRNSMTYLVSKISLDIESKSYVIAGYICRCLWKKCYNNLTKYTTDLSSYRKIAISFLMWLILKLFKVGVGWGKVHESGKNEVELINPL